MGCWLVGDADVIVIAQMFTACSATGSAVPVAASTLSADLPNADAEIATEDFATIATNRVRLVESMNVESVLLVTAAKILTA